ncbi:uncharacterized protein [Branchiostoma lanceolatum]|uniref:uncharacterized protein n=1 Tax=Branchiostoma lanceolatum TaxID=7740 RepID=UPI003452A406
MSDSCPPGFAWDEVVEDCLPCSLCKDFPTTAICQKSPCSDTPGGNLGNGTLPTAAVVGIVVSCVVVMAAVLFLVYRRCWRDRDVTTRPVQVANTDPGEDSDTQRL